ncbi:MAG TPA: hypothetical protein VEW67_04090 [Thermoleophilaceae bacterium]|nr:hypothetical protein [Thermoleophilaceae bacterium]
MTSTSRFVILCGPSGVGKTAIRQALAPRLSAASLGPDDFDGDWSALYAELDLSDRAVVECVALPRALRRRWTARRAIVVKLAAPRPVLEQRLRERGEDAATIVTRLREDTDIGYGDHVIVNLTVDTTLAEPVELAKAIAEQIEVLG